MFTIKFPILPSLPLQPALVSVGNTSLPKTIFGHDCFMMATSDSDKVTSGAGPNNNGCSPSKSNNGPSNSFKTSFFGRLQRFTKTGRWHDPLVALSNSWSPPQGSKNLFTPRNEEAKISEELLGGLANPPVKYVEQEKILTEVNDRRVAIVTTLKDLKRFGKKGGMFGRSLADEDGNFSARFFITRMPDSSGRFYVTTSNAFRSFDDEELLFTGRIDVSFIARVVTLSNIQTSSGNANLIINNIVQNFATSLLGRGGVRRVRI